MAVRVVKAGVNSDGSEYEIVFESEKREELLDQELYRQAIKIAAESGFGIDCAISKTGVPYPVDKKGNPIRFPAPGRTPLKYRRVLSCVHK